MPPPATASSDTCCRVFASRRRFEEQAMIQLVRRLLAGGFAAAIAALVGTVVQAQAPAVKVTDPTSVVMIVNRDSNEIAFMDVKSHQLVGKVFLGNNVNPHMVMMSPDGRYVVTGGTRA